MSMHFGLLFLLYLQYLKYKVTDFIGTVWIVSRFVCLWTATMTLLNDFTMHLKTQEQFKVGAEWNTGIEVIKAMTFKLIIFEIIY